MKKLIIIGIGIMGLVLAAAVAKHIKPATAADAGMVAARTAATNAPPVRLAGAVELTRTNPPATRPQEVADLYTDVITKVEDALKNNK